MKKIFTILITMLLMVSVFTACTPKESVVLLEDTEAFAEEIYNAIPAPMRAELNNNVKNIYVHLSKEGKLTVGATTFEPYTIPLMAESVSPIVINAREKYVNVTAISIKIGDRDDEAVWISEDGEKGTLQHVNKSSDLVVPEINFTIDDMKEYYKNELDKYYSTEEEISEIWDSVTE